MKAVQITAPSEVRVAEVKEPAVSTGEALVRIKHVDFCGSNLNAFARCNPMAKLPAAPGHEVDTIIEEMGPSVLTELKKSMNVTLNSYTNCGKCVSYHSGCVNACEYNETLGVQCNEVMYEHVVLSWNKVTPAGDITPRDCVLVEPVNVGFHAVSREQITDNEYVMVIGYGMIGVGTIVRAALGGTKIIAVDLGDERLEPAKRVGASYVISSKAENVHERMLDITEGFGINVVMETVGSPVTYAMTADEVAFTGRVICIGYVKSEVVFQTECFVQKETDIHGSCNASPADFRVVISYMKSGSCPMEELVSKTVSSGNVLNAMEEWVAASGKVFRTLVQL